MSTDKQAIGERKPKARVGRDYAGIASFAMGTVAAVLVVAGVLASWSHFGLAGLLLITPALLLISPIGFLLAVVAIVRRVDMKWGAVGIALNLSPLVVFLLPGPAPPTYMLTSGKQIKIMSVGPVNFSQGHPHSSWNVKRKVRLMICRICARRSMRFGRISNRTSNEQG